MFTIFILMDLDLAWFCVQSAFDKSSQSSVESRPLRRSTSARTARSAAPTPRTCGSTCGSTRSPSSSAATARRCSSESRPSSSTRGCTPERNPTGERVETVVPEKQSSTYCTKVYSLCSLPNNSNDNHWVHWQMRKDSLCIKRQIPSCSKMDV